MTANATTPGKKVLVIDDNPVVLRSLYSILTIHGFEANVALDGFEVINCMRKERPDIILLDILFPPSVAEGKVVWDGFKILEWLRNEGKAADLPVVIISSCDPERFRDRCLAAGAQAYYSKPLPMKELLETIRTLTSVEKAVTANGGELVAV
jgi:CheY-like chemotaxis protein